MVFTDIRLQNYRSYTDSSFELGGGVTIVVGPNGVGKSNLIEALLLVSNGVSYRGKNGTIKHGAEWARIDVHTTKNTTRTTKISSAGDGKQSFEFKIQDKTYKRLPGSQKQPAVLFEPNNLLLMHGEPQSRREYVDILSSALADGFSILISRYKRTLAQRNALLKTGSPVAKEMFVWNVRLCELAEAIVKQRTATIESINHRLSETYSNISGKDAKLKISYETLQSTSNYSASLMKRLEQDMHIDLARGFTGAGPHRDDFSASLDSQPISTTASRGETRTLVLALKIIELELLEEKTKNRPLLLLDDVFSELDGARRKALTKYLRKYQTVITTTDADVVHKSFSQNSQIIPLQ